MSHPHDPTKCRDLSWLYTDAEHDIRRDRSAQGAFERQMEARSRRGRHLARVFFDEEGRRIGCYTGLVNGQIHVDQESHAGAHREPEPDDAARHAVDRAARIGRAILHADRAHPGTRAILELRFRREISADRLAFGVTAGGLRGSGNVAHLTAAARRAFDASRSRLELTAWVDRLGGKLAANACSAAERALCAQIAREAEALVALSIARFRRHLCRVPEAVERRAREALRAAA